MRLFQCLSKRIMPRGNIYIGKHRLEYTPNAEARSKIRRALEIEERNMLLLRHPYLTFQQSKGHMAHIDRWAIELDRQRRERRDNWWKPVRLEDKLNHLRHSERWDD